VVVCGRVAFAFKSEKLPYIGHPSTRKEGLERDYNPWCSFVCCDIEMAVFAPTRSKSGQGTHAHGLMPPRVEILCLTG